MTKYRNKLSIDGGKEKVISALMRKGFSYSDIKDAFEMIENEEYE
jgi:SOS response regulatory protein OraA/RecX